MLDYVAHRSNQFKTGHINPDLFKRKFDRPLHEYIVEICKNFSVIPGLELHSWKLIEDQTKICLPINPKIFKNRDVTKNKKIVRLVTPNPTDVDLLVLTFKKTIDGVETFVTRNMEVHHQDEYGYYNINGKRALSLIQIVDSSTYVLDDVLNLKALIMGIKLFQKSIKLKTNEGQFKEDIFQIDLFTKKINPLLYYLANFGFYQTLEYFGVEQIMSLTTKVIDPENYLYAETKSKNVYVEIDKRFLKNRFISSFYATLVDVMSEKVRLEDLIEREYWVERLSENFGKRSSTNKNVLISFKRILDKGTLKRLVGFKAQNRRDTFSIVRTAMQNYDDFMKKDNHDLTNKRIRANEVLASHFEKYVTQNINSLLGKESLTGERIDKLLNSIHEKTFIRAVGQHDLWRYENFNDFNAINLSRYTFKGPAGINGNKNKIASVHRDIYPSHYGRIDFNVCSAGGSAGLSGYLASNIQLNGAYFSEKNEPDSYSKDFKKLYEKHMSSGSKYYSNRRDLIELAINTDPETGRVILKRKESLDVRIDRILSNPEVHGLYRSYNGSIMIFPKMKKDRAGRIVLERKGSNAALDKMPKDNMGRIILTYRSGVNEENLGKNKKKTRRKKSDK